MQPHAAMLLFGSIALAGAALFVLGTWLKRIARKGRYKDVDFLLFRDTLGKVREALDGFAEGDLRLAAESVFAEARRKNPQELRAFLLQTVEQLDVQALVRIAERLGQIGFPELGRRINI